MRKKDKLYTVNKYNKRLFGIGGYTLNSDYDKGINFGGISFPSTSPSCNVTQSTISGLDSKDLKPLEDVPVSSSKSNSSFNFGGMGMAAASAIGDIPTGDPRGMWDTADPLFHLAGGRESAVGNAMSDVGVGLTKAGLSSGQPWLALAGGITKGLGSLVNAAFGIKENKENTDFVKKNTSAATSMGNVLASASSNEDLISNAGKLVEGSGFNWRHLYSNGWFTNKGTRLGNSLINKENTALAIQGHGLSTGAKNVDSMQDRNVMRNFAAFGGPLEQVAMTPGAIGHGFMSDYLNNKKQQIEADNNMTNMFAGMPSTMFAEGGKIHIKPENKGKFTETMKRTGKSAEELSHSKNPLTRKRAIFALNARKWKHSDGGPLFAFGGDMETHISDFPTGATHIDAGQSHELNPYEGVQLGSDNQGVPNLVEEGEVVYDDYVYSARIPIDETTKEKFHLPKKKEITYADLAKKLEKEISERPNDPISKAGFDAQMHDLAEQQERQKQEMEAQRAKEEFNALSPEEQVAVMQQAAQQEQMAEEAAVQEQIAQEQAMAQEAAMQQPSAEELAMAEQQQIPVEEVPQINAEGGELDEANEFKKGVQKDSPEEGVKFKKKNEGLRYAGLFGPITGLTMMAAGVGKPDYTRFDDAVERLNNTALATYTPLGSYLRFTPMDIWAEQNRMNANARATDRAIMNSNNPARMAGLLANGYNQQLASGDLYRKALEYNDAKRAQIAEFNRGTDQINSQLGAQTSQFNASALNSAKQHQASLAMQAAKERLDSDASWYNSLYGNINNFYKGLSELGRENVATNWRNILAASNAFGNLNEDILKQLGASKAKGGCIKKRKNKRRGLTF